MMYLRSHRIHLLLAIVTSIFSTCSATQEGFFAIAHMTNGYKALKYAMDAGANAVELDLKFNKTTGLPAKFYHGSPCDCTCYKFIPFSAYGGNLCSLYRRPCNQASNYTVMLDHLLQFPKLALIYLDSKIGDFPDKIQTLAAKNVIQLVEESLFSKGYKGKVLIGGGEDKPYLKSVADYAQLSANKSSIYITLDWNKEGTFDSLGFLTNLSSPNVVFSDGHSFCNPRTFHHAIRTASVNKVNGVISKVFVWTVDVRRSFDIYYRNGARGILTNKIGLLMRWVRENNIRLAVPGDDSLIPATSSQIIHPTCDCTYDLNGCRISKLPPNNTACLCKKNIFKKCTGQVVMCKDPYSTNCKQPEYNVLTCIEGGGNCDGYGNGCDCSYKRRWRKSGCKITKPAPMHTACICHQRLWFCHGHIVRCQNPNALQCINPDKSEKSCILGGGDCGGY